MTEFSWIKNFKILIIPGVSVFGIITNLLNISVFLNPKMKDPSFKYMLVIAINDLIYLGLASYSFMEFCFDCSNFYSYSVQFYIFFVDSYLSSCIAIFNTFLDIVLSLQRSSIILNKKFINIRHEYLMAILLLVSFIYYLPVLFLNQVIEYKNYTNTSQIFYKKIPNELGASLFGQIVPIVLTAIRIFLGSIVLTGINIKNAYHLKKRIDLSNTLMYIDNSSINGKIKKETSLNISNDITKAPKKVKFAIVESEKRPKSNRNINMLVFWIAILYVFGMVPYLIVYSLHFVLDWSPIMEDLTLFAIIFLFLAHGSNIFIYFAFNKLFRRILIKYIRWMGFY